MKLVGQSSQSEPEPAYDRVRWGQMSMTFSVNSRITVSVMLSRNCGSVLSSSAGTSASSWPASAKYSERNSCRAESFRRGFSSLSKAAWISLRGFLAGLSWCKWESFAWDRHLRGQTLGTYMSTKVLESTNGRASSTSRRMSP